MFANWKWPGVGLLTLLVLGATLAAPLFAAAGGGGIVITSIGPDTRDTAKASFVDLAGNIVVAGFTDGPNSAGDYAVLRFKPDGTLDPTFGNGGKVVTQVTNGGRHVDRATAAMDQSTGRIVVAGITLVYEGGWVQGNEGDFSMVRYDVLGNVDKTFGSKGAVLTDLFGDRDEASAMVVQQDDKIVQAGSSITPGGRDFALVRYTANGQLDTTFGAGGVVATDMGFAKGDYPVRAASQTIEGEERIVVLGTVYDGVDSLIALARYTSDGTLDPTFGAAGTGIVITPDFLGKRDGEPNAVAVDALGNIFVAATIAEAPDTAKMNMAVVKYLPNGEMDPSFGEGGVARANVIIGTLYPEHPEYYGNGECWAVALQPDGKIVVAGSGGYYFTELFVARFNPDGSLDDSFGAGGIAVTPFATSCDARSVVVLNDGRIVVSGHTTLDAWRRLIVVVCYRPDGTLDPDFGPPPAPAGISVTPTSGLVTTESGGTASFTVVLNSRPTDDVFIPVASSKPTEGTVSVSSLTFTPDNWYTAQTVTITGVEDTARDGDQPYAITLGPAWSDDPAYDDRDPADASVTNKDNKKKK